MEDQQCKNNCRYLQQPYWIRKIPILPNGNWVVDQPVKFVKMEIEISVTALIKVKDKSRLIVIMLIFRMSICANKKMLYVLNFVFNV